MSQRGAAPTSGDPSMRQERAMHPDDGLPQGRFCAWVTQDFRANNGYRDSQLVLMSYRLAQWALARWGAFGGLWCCLYRWGTSLLVGVELPPESRIGPRLVLFHPHGVVLNADVRMGSDCILRQNVTIGNATRRDGSVRGVASVGSHVEFGAGCVVVGDLHVGDHARISALALVTRDVPAWGVVRAAEGQLVRVEGPLPPA